MNRFQVNYLKSKVPSATPPPMKFKRTPRSDLKYLSLETKIIVFNIWGTDVEITFGDTTSSWKQKIKIKSC